MREPRNDWEDLPPSIPAGKPPGHHSLKETVLSCGHEVLYTSKPTLGDTVWCIRCDAPAVVTGGGDPAKKKLMHGETRCCQEVVNPDGSCPVCQDPSPSMRRATLPRMLPSEFRELALKAISRGWAIVMDGKWIRWCPPGYESKPVITPVKNGPGIALRSLQGRGFLA